MNEETPTAQPLIQPTDFRSAVIRSLLKENNALKLKIGSLEIKEKTMEEQMNENDIMKTRIKEWGQLCNKVDRLEERIAGMVNTEKEEMNIAGKGGGQDWGTRGRGRQDWRSSRGAYFWAVAVEITARAGHT